jgi:hypothetical protein
MQRSIFQPKGLLHGRPGEQSCLTGIDLMSALQIGAAE